MKPIYIINELSLWRFLWDALCRRQAEVLRIEPLMPRARRLLSKLVDSVARGGHVNFIGEKIRELQLLKQYDQRVHLFDVYAKIEGWQRSFYRFDAIDRSIPDYAQAVKHCCCMYLSHQLSTILATRWVRGVADGEEVRIYGVLSDIWFASEDYWADSFPESARPSQSFDRLANAVITLLSGLYAAMWTVSRIRPFGFETTSVFFAADYMAEPDDVEIYREIKDGGRLLYVARSEDYLNSDAPEERQWGDACLRTSGYLSFGSGMRALGWICRDLFRLYRLAGAYPLPCFYRVAALPLRRIEYRALFQRFRPRVYWGRDPYDSGHIIRRQEVNKVGGQSWSYCTSYLTYGSVYPEFRYLDFDRYYMLGRVQYERVYRETWPSAMQIVPAAPYRAWRRHFAQRFESKPKNILVLVSVFASEEAMVNLVRGLADEFPDRLIILQIKANMLINSYEVSFAAKCVEGKRNIEYRTEAPYELFPLARFAISDPSTAVVEAVQFGLFAFFADIFPDQKHALFREIDEICVRDAASAAQRIRALECGSWHYPVERLKDYVDLGGLPFCDQLRVDLGLESRERPRSIWSDGKRESAVAG